MVRAGLRPLLEGEDGVVVVGEAVDGEQALAAVMAPPRRRPDGHPHAEPRRVRSHPPAGRATVYDAGPGAHHLDLDEYVFDALRAGASGFLLKDATAEELIGAVRTLAAGDAVLAPAVTQRLLDGLRRLLPETEAPPVDLGQLTDRELEVLRLLALGLSNAEIAARLVVTDATAKTHVTNVLGKLRLRDRVQAVFSHTTSASCARAHSEVVDEDHSYARCAGAPASVPSRHAPSHACRRSSGALRDRDRGCCSTRSRHS